MRDEHDRALKHVQGALELLDRRNVEMVRRLVEHDAVDAARGEERDEGARTLAGREGAGVAQDVVGAEVELR